MRLPSPPLFWRTFLLILLLLAACLLAWLQSFRALEREPRARQIAQQVVSIVNVTRSALLYSDPSLRTGLLADLADDEGIRIVPAEATDVVVPFQDRPLMRLVAERIRERLGQQTRLAESVNGIVGAWVSFEIDSDPYWVFIARDPLARGDGLQWARWAAAAALLSLLVAVAITRVVNRPLAKLSRAAHELGAGRRPAPLPDTGPVEIRQVNQSFNRMVADLAKLDEDRALLLAGISHDLRTPLTRLRLELEISQDLAPDVRAAMAGDIDQIDAIVRQFLDYARGDPQQPSQPVDVIALLRDTIARQRLPQARIETRLDGVEAVVDGHPMELRRAVDNLIANAARYGRDGHGRLTLTVALHVESNQAVVEIADGGPGIAAAEIERLRRPFQRGDSARGGSDGAGLGLAIVDRIAAQHGGRLVLAANLPTGLRACLYLPLQARGASSS